MSSAKLSKRAAITLGFIGVLVVQAGISFVTKDEPYPAIRMPSFGSAPNKSGLFPTTLTTVKITYADGSTLEPRVTDLMNDFRFSSAPYSFNYMFKPGGTVQPDPEVRAWLAGEARELGNGKSPKRVDMCWRTSDLDIRTATYKNISDCESTVIDL